MPKLYHRVRDPIHIFVRFDADERQVIDSRPFQRLRHVHQLAMTYLVYPGATHKRFEHSLGVMELASRIFDTVTAESNVTDEIRNMLPQVADHRQLEYWRRVVRFAALCHDMGHLPFSHAAEDELLPDGWDHERLTREIVLGDEMQSIWEGLSTPIRPLDIVKVALPPRKTADLKPTVWETILAEIITGDAFGADRMDYLLRDSYHAGVAYGRFDHYRLVDTLRLLRFPSTDQPALGVEEGGLQSAEALLLARYFIYSQVYLHPVRRIYDIHLQDFLKDWLADKDPPGLFPTDVEHHLRVSDNEVLSSLSTAARDEGAAGHVAARRIAERNHFRLLYQPTADDRLLNLEPGRAIFEEGGRQPDLGPANLRHSRYREREGAIDFPVLRRDESVASSLNESTVIAQLPVITADCVFVSPDKYETANAWLAADKAAILLRQEEEVER